MQRSHRDSASVWDQNKLADNPDLSSRLDEFGDGTVGNSVRCYDTSGRSAEQIHTDLLQRGFRHQREPLAAGNTPDGRPLYRRRDGSRTVDPTDPEIVPHDIYTHPDGGMVRVKPEGDPGSPHRPGPHASKSVLHDPNGGTGFENEAFIPISCEISSQESSASL